MESSISTLPILPSRPPICGAWRRRPTRPLHSATAERSFNGCGGGLRTFADRWLVASDRRPVIDSACVDGYLSVCNDMKAGAMTATFTSREFNRDPGSIKRAALSGPVFITDRNKPSLVVMAIKDYERLAGRGTSLLDLLMPDDDQDFDFEPPKASIKARPVDFD